MINAEEQGEDFLFTWKPDKWPYENLRVLIDDFEAGKTVTQNWRCRAIRRIRPGSRGYLLRQGTPRGIFGIATITGVPQKRLDTKPGESEFEVPLRFDLLVDPAKRFLIPENELLKLPAPSDRWKSVASGMPLEKEAARIIDQIAARTAPVVTASTPSKRDSTDSGPPSKTERLVEVYARDQSLVDELKRLYQDNCQICSSSPFNGHFGNIVEGHHIKWLCRGGKDTLDNMMLLCPNEMDPDFGTSR